MVIDDGDHDYVGGDENCDDDCDDHAFGFIVLHAVVFQVLQIQPKFSVLCIPW